jgi:hypothetical protein
VSAQHAAPERRWWPSRSRRRAEPPPEPPETSAAGVPDIIRAIDIESARTIVATATGDLRDLTVGQIGQLVDRLLWSARVLDIALTASEVKRAESAGPWDGYLT